MAARARAHFYLLACFAVLFNLLAMPLDRALQTPRIDRQSLILGSFCSLHGAQSLPKSLLAQLKAELPQLDEQPATKNQAGDCCCGHAGHALLASDYYRHLFPASGPMHSCSVTATGCHCHASSGQAEPPRLSPGLTRR
ncbi:DUF2946 family protein [Pseudomonas juntendi]|nr:DUF2946 family protein [Pseudomonas juntendi]